MLDVKEKRQKEKDVRTKDVILIPFVNPTKVKFKKFQTNITDDNYYLLYIHKNTKYFF